MPHGGRDLVPTFVLMEVSQVLLVREDDGLVLSDDLAPEALPARGQLPQLLQLTHSASKTHARQAVGPAPLPGEAPESVPTRRTKCMWVNC